MDWANEEAATREKRGRKKKETALGQKVILTYLT